jgi:thiol-disulfide isomerase/thioredoxin
MRNLALAFCALPILAFGAGPTVKSPLLTGALSQAKKQNKLVFVCFSASWCGPCRQLHGVLEHDPVKPIFDKYFVTVNVTIFENGEKAKLNSQGGDKLLKELGGFEAGIPFFAFIKPDGSVVGDSFMGNKQNMGCPMTSEEIGEFFKTISKVAPKMSKAEQSVFRSAFVSASKG